MNIQITSFDGAYSNQPWMLRVEESPAIELPPGCKTPLALGGGTTRALPASVGGNTLYLFNSKRYGDLYGNANETAVWNKLQTLAARADAAGGTVIPIDAIPGMGATLGAWQANPCSAGLNNDVVRALGHLPRRDHGGLQVHRDRRRLDRAARRSRARQHALRQRARLRVHVLRRREHAVPELLCARLSADRRSLRRHELLRPGCVHPRGGGRPPRREPQRDHGPARPVPDEERGDRPGDGPRHRLRLPVGRRVRGLRRAERRTSRLRRS